MAATPDIWIESFSDEERQVQEEDDRRAWRAIAGILMGIVVVGLFLGISTVMIVLSS
jgi:hypothetical protein